MPLAITWSVLVLMPVIGFGVWVLFHFASREVLSNSRQRKTFAIASGVLLLSWLVFAYGLALEGAFEAEITLTFPRIAIGIGVPLLAGVILLYGSPTAKTVSSALSLPWLVGIQLYRVVGLNFLVLYALGLLPGEFALPAGIGDVIVGLTAPLVGYALYKQLRWSKAAAVAWNVFGILDLVVAIGTGFLTSPGPLQSLALQSSNELISKFPLVLVPVFAVPLSILLHLAALRLLRTRQRPSISLPKSYRDSNSETYRDRAA